MNKAERLARFFAFVILCVFGVLLLLINSPKMALFEFALAALNAVFMFRS